MSLKDVFMSGKYNVGNGLATYFGLPKNGIHLIGKASDIPHSQQAIEDICSNLNAMNHLESSLGVENILISSYNKLKWALGYSNNFKPTDYDDINDLVNSNSAIDKLVTNANDVDRFRSYFNDIVLYSRLYNVAKFFAFDSGIDAALYDDPWAFLKSQEFKDLVDNMLTSELVELGPKIFASGRINPVLNSMKSGDVLSLHRENGHTLLGNWKLVDADAGIGSYNQYIRQYHMSSYHEFRFYGRSDSSGYASAYSEQCFDLTNIDSIDFTYEIVNAVLTGRFKIGVYDRNDQEYFECTAEHYDSSAGNEPLVTRTVDVSTLTGKYYLKVGFYDDDSNADADFYMRLHDIKLKKN